MSPRNIVAAARRAGLDLIAICDHNAGESGKYARRVAHHTPEILMGMEIQTVEEVEILALFPAVEPCLALQEELYELLPPVPNDPQLFGDQLVVDEEDEIVRTIPKLLLAPVPLSLEEAAERVRNRGGLVIPAHVERIPGGILGVLGLLPPGDWPAVEVSPWAKLEEVLARWPEIRGRQVFRSSDAHVPEEIGRAWTELYLRRPSFPELERALAQRGDRLIRPSPQWKEEKG